MLGLLSNKLQATLHIGTTVTFFASLNLDQLMGDHITLELVMATSESDRLRGAVRSVDADSHAFLMLRLAPIKKSATVPSSPVTLSQAGG